MKRLRESITALLLLAALGVGTWTVLSHPKALLESFRAEYQAARPENPTFVQKLETAVAGAEGAVAGRLSEHTELITLYGGFQRLLGNRLVRDVSNASNVVKLNNGQISFVTIGAEPGDPSRDAALLNDFSAYTEGLGVPTLFVLAPQKIGKYDDSKPAGADEYGNENSDRFLSLLEGKTASLDLRERFHRSEKGHAAYFFNTDHHWTPEGALLGCAGIAERLAEDYGFSIDMRLVAPESYRKVTYEDIFLGSQGKRVGPWYAGTDDLTLLLPEEDSGGYTFRIPHKDVTRSGSFEDAFLFYEMVAAQDYYHLNPYVVYTGGDYPLSIAENANDTTGKRLLLIRQSFSCALAPYLARLCAELDILDPRYYEGSIREYVAETRPDAVLVVYCASDTCNELLFEPLAK